jgi:hypothetical protein
VSGRLRLLLALAGVVVVLGCAREARRAAVLPLDPLTAEEERAAVQLAVADPGVRQLLGESRHRVISVEFVSLKPTGAPAPGSDPNLAGPIGRFAQVLVYRPDANVGVKALVDLGGKAVTQTLRVEGSRVPLTEDDVAEARELALKSAEVRRLFGAVGPDEFRAEGLRSIGFGPQDACFRNRCVHLLFRRGEHYLVTPAIVVDLTARTVRVESR